MRALVFLCVLISSLALAQTDDQTKCNDGYADCHDTCSLRHGLVARDSERLKLAKCVDKCKRVQGECLERFFETKNNALDDGALQKKPDRNDDLREDDKKTAIVPEDKPKKRERDPAESQPKRTATRADELGKDDKKKSDGQDPRYDMKFEEEKKPEPKKEEKREETARAEEPKPAPEKKKSSSSESSSEKPKKKERALDEWDPEAL